MSFLVKGGLRGPVVSKTTATTFLDANLFSGVNTLSSRWK